MMPIRKTSVITFAAQKYLQNAGYIKELADEPGPFDDLGTTYPSNTRFTNHVPWLR